MASFWENNKFYSNQTLSYLPESESFAGFDLTVRQHRRSLAALEIKLQVQRVDVAHGPPDVGLGVRERDWDDVHLRLGELLLQDANVVHLWVALFQLEQHRNVVVEDVLERADKVVVRGQPLSLGQIGTTSKVNLWIEKQIVHLSWDLHYLQVVIQNGSNLVPVVEDGQVVPVVLGQVLPEDGRHDAVAKVHLDVGRVVLDRRRNVLRLERLAAGVEQRRVIVVRLEHHADPGDGRVDAVLPVVDSVRYVAGATQR